MHLLLKLFMPRSCCVMNALTFEWDTQQDLFCPLHSIKLSKRSFPNPHLQQRKQRSWARLIPLCSLSLGDQCEKGSEDQHNCSWLPPNCRCSEFDISDLIDLTLVCVITATTSLLSPCKSTTNPTFTTWIIYTARQLNGLKSYVFKLIAQPSKPHLFWGLLKNMKYLLEGHVHPSPTLLIWEESPRPPPSISLPQMRKSFTNSFVMNRLKHKEEKMELVPLCGPPQVVEGKRWEQPPQTSFLITLYPLPLQLFLLLHRLDLKSK